MKKTVKKNFLRVITTIVMAFMLLSAVSCGVKSSNQKNPATAPAPEGDTFIEVPIFTSDLEVGKKVTADKVTTKKINAKAVSDTMLTAVDEVVGKYTTVGVVAGDYAYKGKLSSKRPTESENTSDIEKTRNKYIDVALFIEPNTGEDVYDALQKLIDENTNRTIYFSDGEYIISKPLQTSGAALRSTSFYLSDNAVIKAADNWKGGDDALVRMGIGDSNTENNITLNGSNFHFIGGILDGNGKARGISLLGGRESLVSKVKIINATVGLHIGKGVNSNSSDMDVEDVDIIGNGGDSVGIVVEGFDNNFVDVRISNVKIGVDAKAKGNFYRGVSVKLDDPTDSRIDYESTVGFICYEANWFYSCSSENMATGFRLTDTRTPSTKPIIKDFSIRWTGAYGPQTAFEAPTVFAGYCSDGIIDFFDESTENSILDCTGTKAGIFLDVIADTELCDEENYKSVFVKSTVKEEE